MTKIEWVKNPNNITRGITVNSKTGCRNHTPEGLCLGGMFPCYAFKLANGRLKQRYLANHNYAPPPKNILLPNLGFYEFDPFYPRFWPERLEQIRKHKKPIGIFLDDMSDWMGYYWPKAWTEMELQVMRDCPQHRFYTLTKQPQNLPEWSPFPPNCWVGVTATNLEQYRQAILHLAIIDANIKFISFEPLLEHIHLTPNDAIQQGWLDWLIIGAQTNPYKPPKIECVQEIVEAAARAGIPVFLKDNLKPLFEKGKLYPHCLNSLGFLRQEMPK